MTLYEHAEYELKLIRCDEPERSALLAAVKGFATGGWSGGGVGWGIQTLTRLLEFKPLSDITSDPNEWTEVGPSVWQSKRRSTSFSRDGGRTWYDIEDPSLNNGDVWQREEGTWEPVQLGTNVQVGSRVRVRQDAFSPESRLASLHNGRAGELTLVDAGRCVVRFGEDDEFRYDPGHLEVLKTAE